jgi:arsenite methyltransferase
MKSYGRTTITVFALICGMIMAIIFSCEAHMTAEHFNSLASNRESQPDRVVESLELKPGNTVADIGSGGGYFTILMARKVGPKGKVYAIDIDAELLKYVDALVKKEGVANVTTVLATESDSGISAKRIDLVFMRNVFHDLKNDTAYFAKLKPLLKDGGRIAIIDYRPGNIIWRLFGHFVEENEIVSLMKSAGYDIAERHTYLKDQSFNIFISVADNEKK